MSDETPSTEGKRQSHLFLTLRALRSRNYRLFFFGQLISLIGTWITTVATSWLVFRLTKDSSQLGLVNFASQVPTFLIIPFAGVLMDRWNLHRTLIATQTAAMLQSAALAILTYTESISVQWVIALSVAQGIINGFDLPARQTFLIQMIEDRNDLPNAIALNSSLFNAARLVGPALAGILIAAFGEASCFTIDTLSYMGVIAALLAMTVTPPARRTSHAHVLHDLAEGVQYSIRFSPIRSILWMTGSVGLLAIPSTVLMPIFSSEILGGGPETLGALMGASGFGAVIGGLVLAARPSVRGLGRQIPKAGLVSGLALIAFSLSQNLILSLIVVAITGFCTITQLAASNTILQTVVPEEKRGRVLSLFSMAFQGTMPLGSLLAGIVAQPHYLGPILTIALSGSLTIVAAIAFWIALPIIRSELRAIYSEKGIM